MRSRVTEPLMRLPPDLVSYYAEALGPILDKLAAADKRRLRPSNQCGRASITCGDKGNVGRSPLGPVPMAVTRRGWPARGWGLALVFGCSMALFIGAVGHGSSRRTAVLSPTRPISPATDPPPSAITRTSPPPTTAVTPPSTVAAAAPAAPADLGAPADLAPLAPGTYHGEGHWVPAGRRINGRPAVWTTSLRPPSGGAPVGVARLDTSILEVALYAGTSQPGGSWTYQGEVSAGLAPQLVAAFNGGFQFQTSPGGFYADGRASPALVNGRASLVCFADGSATIAQWGRDVTLGPNVAFVRQNLDLLVDAGAPTPQSAYPGRWGAVLGGGAATWRSGLGADDARTLFFVGGPGLTPAGLASVLVDAGARRAMEYDINPQWVLFSSFTDGAGSPPSTVGTNLLATMHYPPSHFFSADWRDFVAVFERPPTRSS